MKQAESRIIRVKVVAIACARLGNTFTSAQRLQHSLHPMSGSSPKTNCLFTYVGHVRVHIHTQGSCASRRVHGPADNAPVIKLMQRKSDQMLCQGWTRGRCTSGLEGGFRFSTRNGLERVYASWFQPPNHRSSRMPFPLPIAVWLQN